MGIKATVTAVLTGIPDLATAQARLEQSQQAVVAASQALDACKVAKMAADESGEADKIVAAESAEIAADRVLERAVRQEQIHQRHYRRALEARTAEERAAGVAKLKVATAQHLAAAKRAQQAVNDLAQAANELDQIDETIYLLQRAKHASSYMSYGTSYGPQATRSRVRMELERRAVLTGYVPEGMDDIPTWSERLAATLQLVDSEQAAA